MRYTIYNLLSCDDVDDKRGISLLTICYNNKKKCVLCKINVCCEAVYYFCNDVPRKIEYEDVFFDIEFYDSLKEAEKNYVCKKIYLYKWLIIFLEYVLSLCKLC